MSLSWNDAPWALTRRFETRSQADVEAAIRGTLAENGFGILTEIDIQSTLREKAGVERRPYKLLGACSPRLADEALQAVPAVGLFLPCNVVITEDDDGATRLAILNPQAMLAPMGEQPQLAALMDAATARLNAALDAV